MHIPACITQQLHYTVNKPNRRFISKLYRPNEHKLTFIVFRCGASDVTQILMLTALRDPPLSFLIQRIFTGLITVCTAFISIVLTYSLFA